MTKRIFWAILAVTMVIFLSGIGIMMGVLYNNFTEQYLLVLKNEAVYTAREIEDHGTAQFGERWGGTNRITWIDAGGKVLYDSVVDENTMENHQGREEIQEALETGEGDSVRYSATLATETVNYAMLMSDGTVLRVSGSRNSVWMLLAEVMQPLSILVLLAMLCAALVASWVAKLIVKPLNTIDLENPETEIYEEVEPLLTRLSEQNHQIRWQIEEIRRRQEEFAAITRNMSEGLLILDRAGRVLTHNSSALRLLGREEIRERQSALTLSRNENFRSAIQLALVGQHSEQMMEHAGRLYQIIANPVYQEEIWVGVVIILLDVTEKAEQERLRREFTANVSHELKTPLTSISGYAEIIKAGIVRPEDVSQFAGKIYDESQRLIALVGDILRLSRLDEGESFEKEDVRLDQMLQEVVGHLQPQADKKNVSLRVQAEEVSFIGVRRILEEILYNLCDNAIKYNYDGGSVTVTITAKEQQVYLTVADTGIGIPAADQQRVFERFYRVDKSHSREIGGTGLGLSIVKHGVAYHKGEVSLRSEEGSGTAVTVTFPR